MADCKTCGAYCITERHQCPPKWLVLDKDYCGDDWSDAYAVYEHRANEAAGSGAKAMDNGSDGPNERSVYVRLAPEGQIEGPFDVTFDYSIDYFVQRR